MVHTLEGYRQAIRQGADEITVELVSSRDGVLVARHDSELFGSTDIATRPEFAERRSIREVDGLLVYGWFVEEFTLAELKRLTARERWPDLRCAGSGYDDSCGIATFNEVLAMVQAESVRSGRRARVIAELRNPSYSAALGLPLDLALRSDLRRHGLDHAHSLVSVVSSEAQYFGSSTQATM